MLVVCVFSKIANGFDAKYLDTNVVCGKVFVEEVVIFVFTVNCVDLALIVETLIEMLHNILNHHNF
jgi:hypothetical protein